jgi:PadR family transcriptional regulator PadR
MTDLNSYEQKLLEGWEEVAKKGQLTLWIMLALKDGPKHMSQIKLFVHSANNGMIGADDQSLYRALRRFSKAGLVNFSSEPGKKGGPDLKVYNLEENGRKVLQAFVQRNIVAIYFKDNVKELFE